MPKTLLIGSPIPEFKGLRGVDGNEHSVDEYRNAKALVVVFSCNHCPYVQAYEERMIAFAKQYESRGVQLVAINSNETQNYPEDNFDEMVKRARARGFPFPYLRDEDQSVAGAFDATHTPEFFLFAAAQGETVPKLRYRGKMDDNWRDPSGVQRRYLKEAVECVLAGRPVAEAETHSIGCTIKWR